MALSPDQKLRALGLKLASSQKSPLSEEFDELETQINNLSNGFSEFQNDVSNQSSWAEFEDYLINTLGMTSEDAKRLRNKYESFYSSFSDFQTKLSSFSSFSEWKNSFTWGNTVGGTSSTDDGKMVNGIRFFEEPGVTRGGVQVGGGTVEVFGTRLEFSETSGSSGASDDPSSVIDYSNMSVSPNLAGIGEQFTASVDITNTDTATQYITPTLIIDGSTIKTNPTTSISAGRTITASFTHILYETGDYEVRINKAPAVTLSVEP